MTAYYNEFDPCAAAWLRELIKRGHIADGVVDERSILDVSADDLLGFTQCHFFAGIGGWSYALRLAGWPDDRPVWTGSPPCQPFSSAGRQLGRDDERHLAPHFISLVGAVRPPVLFGEQVASAAVFGGAAKSAKRGVADAPEWAWLDDLSDRLEAAHYAVGASDIPAAGIGAPHIRQRTFFGAVRLADADTASEGVVGSSGIGLDSWETRNARIGPRGCCLDGGLADAANGGRQQRDEDDGRVRCGDNPQGEAGRSSVDVNVGYIKRPDAPDSPWGNPDWLFCRDGKWRPVEPGTSPLAHGVYNSLANVLSICKLASDRVDEYAGQSETNPSEIMRMVREYLYKKTGWEKQPTGMRGKLYAPEVLLNFMLNKKAACDRATDISSIKKEGKETVAGAMRIMRMDGGFVHPSHQWRPNGQQIVKSANALHELSFLLARDAQAFGEAVLDAHAAINRVGMLRGYGNAIVPQAAAAFIGAFMEALQ